MMLEFVASALQRTNGWYGEILEKTTGWG